MGQLARTKAGRVWSSREDSRIEMKSRKRGRCPVVSLIDGERWFGHRQERNSSLRRRGRREGGGSELCSFDERERRFAEI